MRIDPKVITPTTSYTTREQAPTTAKAPASEDSSSASVVKLSSAGAAASAESAKPAITQKLAAIKSAIAAGQYPVDLDKLASRIVDDEVNRGGSSS